MITFSVLVSLVSVALAIGMSLVLAHVVRAERRRSDARVAALSQMAIDDFMPEPEPASDTPVIAEEAPDGLFKEAAADSPWGTRIAIAGALALVATVVLGIASLRSTTSITAGRQAETVATPLQLLELGHTQSGAGLTVAGRVQNPRGGQAVSDLTATVFLFDQSGSFMTSGRSSLEVPTLGAGVASAFSVTIPVNGPVARYRVSFRDSSGRPVTHVDRRNPASLARNAPNAPNE